LAGAFFSVARIGAAGAGLAFAAGFLGATYSSSSDSSQAAYFF
jgi:hypothetical protein